MTMEFGWWATDDNGRRYQVRVEIYGGTATWLRKQGHHQSWAEYGPPTNQDWDALFEQAGRRVPRRLLSPKQFEALKRLRGGG